jgi:hypothetical protein
MGPGGTLESSRAFVMCLTFVPVPLTARGRVGASYRHIIARQKDKTRCLETCLAA